MTIKLPKTIKVGYADYKIVQMKREIADADSKDGHCNVREHIITIRAENRPQSEIANTLLHEVMHAIWYMWGNGSGQEEETCVTTLSNGLLTVMRDNKEFVEYTTEACCADGS